MVVCPHSLFLESGCQKLDMHGCVLVSAVLEHL
jgi:hypothetical protein